MIDDAMLWIDAAHFKENRNTGRAKRSKSYAIGTVRLCLIGSKFAIKPLIPF